MNVSNEGSGTIIRDVCLLLGSMGLAILGGLVRALNCPRKDFSWWTLLTRILAAAFVGGLVQLLLSHLGVSERLQCAMAGGCGYAAIDLLDAFAPLIVSLSKKKLGIGSNE